MIVKYSLKEHVFSFHSDVSLVLLSWLLLVLLPSELRDGRIALSNKKLKVLAGVGYSAL